MVLGILAEGDQHELEAQFAQWRQYVGRRRELRSSDADELEDHLRGCVGEPVARRRSWPSSSTRRRRDPELGQGRRCRGE
jgi:hypothetical protein